MGRYWIVPALLLLLLVAPAEAQWANGKCSPERQGLVDGITGPFDVVSVLRLHGEDLMSSAVVGQTLFPRGNGVVTMATTGGPDCTLVVLDDWRTPNVHETQIPRCMQPLLVGYDPVSDTLLVSPAHTPGADTSDGEEAPTLLGVHVGTGTISWQVSPADIGWPASTPEGGAAPGAPAPIAWDAALVVEDRVAYAAFFATRAGADPGHSRLAAISLDARPEGQVMWHRGLSLSPLAASTTGLPIPANPTGASDAVSAAAMATAVVTADDRSIYVTGYTPCPTCDLSTDPDDRPRTFHFGMLWTDRLGEPKGMYIPGMPHGASGQAEPVTQTRFSRSVVSVNGQGTGLFDDDLVSASSLSSVAAVVPLETSEVSIPGLLSAHSPVTDGQTLFVPLYTRITAVTVEHKQPIWAADVSRPGGYWLPDLLVSPRGDLFATWVHGSDDGRSNQEGEVWSDHGLFSWHDARDGRLRQELRLPLMDVVRSTPYLGTPAGGEKPARWGIGVDTVPLPGGHLAAFNGMGDLVVIGPSRGHDLATVNTMYPAVGESVEVTIDHDGRSLIAWGDGASTLVEPGDSSTAVHDYRDSGDHTLLVTVTHPDNTTSTKELTIHVGGELVRLNFLQQAFARDNQDVTFGVLGLGTAAAGAIIGIVLRRRSHSRVRQGLHDIDAVRAGSHQDPLAALVSARRLHDRFHSDFLAGRVDEDQHRLLTDRTLGLMQKLARRWLVLELNDASLSFQNLLWAVLDDEVVTDHEREAIRAAAERERGLPGTFHANLTRLLDAWAGRPSVAP